MKNDAMALSRVPRMVRDSGVVALLVCIDCDGAAAAAIISTHCDMCTIVAVRASVCAFSSHSILSIVRLSSAPSASRLLSRRVPSGVPHGSTECVFVWCVACVCGATSQVFSTSADFSVEAISSVRLLFSIILSRLPRLHCRSLSPSVSLFHSHRIFFISPRIQSFGILWQF